MKTVRQVLKRPAVWVNPDHSVDTAAVLMKGHRIGALPVVESGRVVGIVQYDDVLGEPPHRPVSEVMDREVITVSPDQAVSDAARIMGDTGRLRLPVVEEGRLIGMLTSGDVMPYVSRSQDPITELPWSDGLREWMEGRFHEGRELCILFIDLDAFGQFNKAFGHIVGDQVLRSVARTLQTAIDPRRDFVCRYGGDEFCIGTLRSMWEAEHLAKDIEERIESIRVEGAGESAVTCTIGLAGGKRTREREDTHPASMVNNLINVASRDSMDRKAQNLLGAVQAGQAGSAPPFVHLAGVTVEWQDRSATVRVELEVPADSTPGSQPRRFAASLSGETDEAGLLRLIAETTANSLGPILPEGHRLHVGDVLLNHTTDGKTVITAVGQYSLQSESWNIAGSAVVTDDSYRSAAAAVLAGVNRLIERYGLRTETAAAPTRRRKG